MKAAVTHMAETTYEKEIQAWRSTLESTLRKENSWLALAGLFWLKEGLNTFGSNPDNDIVLPAGSAPDKIGAFFFSDGSVRLYVDAGEEVEVDGFPVNEATLDLDVTGAPSTVEIGNLAMIAIKRGDRYGIRLWDNSRPERHTFPPRSWYPVQEAYRIQGKFVPHVEPVTITLPSASGECQEIPSVGDVSFSLHDECFSLKALEGPAMGLFLIFKDLTNGKHTYPAGRYLTTPAPEGGKVTIDFNRAYNPPCAFTDFATCALPPQENQVDEPIEAGERYHELNE